MSTGIGSPSCCRKREGLNGIENGRNANRLVAAFPTGSDERDTTAIVMVVSIVLVVTLLATYIPARRAARVNPVEALRHEWRPALRSLGSAANPRTPSECICDGLGSVD